MLLLGQPGRRLHLTVIWRPWWGMGILERRQSRDIPLNGLPADSLLTIIPEGSGVRVEASVK